MKDGQGRPVILFHLKRFWEGWIPATIPRVYTTTDLYEEIKEGRKTSEWRDNTEYWRKRLISTIFAHSAIITHPKHELDTGNIRAWFVVGYPKGNIPRLEATITEVVDVTEVVYDEELNKLEIKFKDVEEVIGKW